MQRYSLRWLGLGVEHCTEYTHVALITKEVTEANCPSLQVGVQRGQKEMGGRQSAGQVIFLPLPGREKMRAKCF